MSNAVQSEQDTGQDTGVIGVIPKTVTPLESIPFHLVRCPEITFSNRPFSPHPLNLIETC